MSSTRVLVQLGYDSGRHSFSGACSKASVQVGCILGLVRDDCLRSCEVDYTPFAGLKLCTIQRVEQTVQIMPLSYGTHIVGRRNFYPLIHPHVPREKDVEPSEPHQL